MLWLIAYTVDILILGGGFLCSAEISKFNPFFLPDSNPIKHPSGRLDVNLDASYF